MGTAPRIVGIDRLRERLQILLGTDSLLFRRFEKALRTRDPERVASAMDALALYPPTLREQIEDALLAWLLDEPLGTAGSRSDGRGLP
jgi:hypothetical protein